MVNVGTMYIYTKKQSAVMERRHDSCWLLVAC